MRNADPTHWCMHALIADRMDAGGLQDLKRSILSRGRHHAALAARAAAPATGQDPELAAVSHSLRVINNALVMCQPTYSQPSQDTTNTAFTREALELARPELSKLLHMRTRGKTPASRQGATMAYSQAVQRIKAECRCDDNCQHSLAHTHHDTVEFDSPVEVLTASGKRISVPVTRRHEGTHDYPS